MVNGEVAGHAMLSFDSIASDAKAESRLLITEELILDFAKLTGDANPLHTDPVFGAATPFGRINAQGQLMSSLMVGIVGSKLPGAGWFCLGVDASFIQPCFGGDAVLVGVSLRQKVSSVKVIVWDGYLKRLSDDQILARAVIKTKCMF